MFCLSVTEIKEGSEYQINFCSGGHNLMLIVILTKDFPNEKPIIKISPPIIHPWVNNESEVISAPGLLNVCYNVRIYIYPCI